VGNTSRRHPLLWRTALLAGLSGGIGGLVVDFDHILNVTTGIVRWSEFHTVAVFLFLCGLFIASLGGLLLTLVLRR